MATASLVDPSSCLGSLVYGGRRNAHDGLVVVVFVFEFDLEEYLDELYFGSILSLLAVSCHLFTPR